MAKKKKTEHAPRVMTRRAISAHKRQERRQRFIFFGGIAIIAAIILTVAAGWTASEYIPMHKTVISVNGVRYNTGDLIGYMEMAAITQQAQGQQPNLSLIASNAVQLLPEAELMREAADELGITVSDDEAIELLEANGLPVNDGTIAFMRTGLLQEKMRADYFTPMVPGSDNQVWTNIMLLESEQQALEVKAMLEAGDNFTSLASEYALNYYSKNLNDGDFGWKSEEVLYDQLGSQVPVDFAFSAGAGALSDPLVDPEMQKNKGYWLIKVLNEPSAESANVSAIFVSSRVLAEELIPQLESTDNITAIADAYTQYSPSKEKHGELGEVDKAGMTDAFNDYVFSENATIGQWSQPIPDEVLWTTGGAWLVKVVDRAENKELSQQDHDYLIDKRFNEWYGGLDQSTADIDTGGLTPELQQLAIERAARFLQELQG